MTEFLGLVGQSKSRILVAILCSIFAAFLALVPLWAIYVFANELLSGQPDKQMLQYTALAVAVAVVVRWLLMFFSSFLAHTAAFRVLFDLRLRVAEKMAYVPLGFILAQKSGDLKRTLHEDVDRIEMFLAHMVPDVGAALGLCVGSIIALFWLDPIMALATLLPLPFAMGFQLFLWRRSEHKSKEYFDSAGRLNASVIEYIRGIPVIKAFGLNHISLGRMRASIEHYRNLVADFSNAFIPAWAAFMTLLNSSLLFLLPIGGWKLINGSLSVSQFILFMLLGVGLLPKLMTIMSFGNMLRSVMMSMGHIKSVLDEPSMPEGSSTQLPENFDISFQDVSFSYDKEEVLSHINATFKNGEKTAIVGSSGAGKTTLAQLIVRFWDPSTGNICIGDVNLKELSTPVLNEVVTCVFQEVFLFHDTIFNNIKIGRTNATDEEVYAAAKTAHIHDFIDSLPESYQTMIGDRGARLSGGQKQRISIARAILRDTPVIVLDEATAFADPVNERLILQALENLCENKTVVMIAHRLSTIQNADQIIVLEKGNMVDHGTHLELIGRCQVYQRLWDAYSNAQAWDEPNSIEKKGVLNHV